MNLSPLRQAPTLPVSTSGLVPVLWLTVAAAVISVLGYLGWRRRDLTG
jgi:putative exporter of polyketide antibiotics